jgi:hypothetical protein
MRNGIKPVVVFRVEQPFASVGTVRYPDVGCDVVF